MTTEKYLKAIEIVSLSLCAKVSFNVPKDDNYSSIHQILIHNCCATLIKQLIEEGYSLFMTDKGLSIDNFK